MLILTKGIPKPSESIMHHPVTGKMLIRFGRGEERGAPDVGPNIFLICVLYRVKIFS